ncbi:hypothetical protein AGABI1DRAFT_96273, partial [Agaricus bisporus var. burnettii JB137-S8]
SPSVGGTPTQRELSPAPIQQPDSPDQVPVVRRSQRTRQPSQKAREILEGKAITVVEELDWEEVHVLVTEMEIMEALEPRTWKEATQRTDWPLWKKAMEEELATLQAAGTWELVDCPLGINIVGSNYIILKPLLVTQQSIPFITKLSLGQSWNDM